MNSNVPMTQETKPRQIAQQSPVLRGLSVEQRHPEATPFTCPNSTHLHSTRSHLRYSLLIAPNHKFIFANMVKRSHHACAEESSLWLDFGNFCGNLPMSSSAFPAVQPLLRTPVRLLHLNEPGHQTAYFYIYG
jgi:hypothetical protein